MKCLRGIHRQSSISYLLRMTSYYISLQNIEAYVFKLPFSRLYAINRSSKVPTRSLIDKLRPVSSKVSLIAVYTILSPSSHLPPGRQIQPEYNLPFFILCSNNISVSSIISIYLRYLGKLLFSFDCFLDRRSMIATALSFSFAFFVDKTGYFFIKQGSNTFLSNSL